MAAGAAAPVPLSRRGSSFGRKDEGSTSAGPAPPRSPGKGSLTAAPIRPGSNGNGVRMCPLLHSQLRVEAAGRAQCCLCGFPHWFWDI